MSRDILDHLDRSNTVAIITTRPNGDRVATPIWSAVVDGVGYVRSAYGPDAVWYRRAKSGRPVAFSLADGHLAERDATAVLSEPAADVVVAYVPADDDLQSAADEAFSAKYGRERQSLATMLTDLARGCTLRVDAA